MKVRGRNCMCNVSGTEGGGGKKAVGLGGQKVHTSGWINFVCIGCWVRSLNMSLYFGVCLRL